jgi:hypothetical protein
MHSLKRREVITLLGGAAAWPLAARAQQPTRIRRLGVLLNLSENDVEAQRLVKAFGEGLAQSADQIRTRHQSQNCEDAWPHHPGATDEVIE